MCKSRVERLDHEIYAGNTISRQFIGSTKDLQPLKHLFPIPGAISLVSLFGAIPLRFALLKVAGALRKLKDPIVDMAAVTNGIFEGAPNDAGIVNAPAKTFDTILVLDFGYA